MTFLEKYYSLENEVDNKFQNLVMGSHKGFDMLGHDLSDDEDWKEIKPLIEKEGYVEAFSYYDIFAYVDGSYYNDHRGETLRCIILKVDTDGLVHIFDEHSHSTLEIDLYDLDSLYEKITLVEAMQNIKQI